MRRFLFALGLLLALAAPARAQTLLPTNQIVSVQDSGTACSVANTCASWSLLTAFNSVTMQIIGTWSGTLTFEATANGNTWASVQPIALSTGVLSATTTANDQFAFSNTGLLGFRVRATAWSSGTATVALTQGAASTVRAFSSTPSFNAAVTVNGNGLATTSTDGIVLQNTTPATAGVTVQISPRFKWGGTAWNSTASQSEVDQWYAEILPATVAGTTTSTWRLLRNQNGGAFTQMLSINNSGTGSFTGSLAAQGSVTAGASGTFNFSGRAAIFSSTDGEFKLHNAGGTNAGVEVSVGTAAPTVTTCGTGSITAHSSNTAGGFTTGNAVTACTVSFGTPGFINAPFCVISNTTANRGNISALATGSFTVSNLTASDVVTYICFGGSI